MVALPSCIVYDCTIVLSGTKIKYGDNPKHTKLLSIVNYTDIVSKVRVY